MKEIVDGSPGRKHGAWIEDSKCGGRSCDGKTPAEYVGSCPEGCCDDYRCRICGEVFRIEWPD